MANAQTHEDQAKHNYKVLKELQTNSECRDWQITVAFYTALHVIDCELEKKTPDWKKKYMSQAVDSGWYPARNEAINFCFRDIYNNYRMLMIKSRIMRYLEAEAANRKAIDAITEEEAKNFINKHLGTILKRFNYSW